MKKRLLALGLLMALLIAGCAPAAAPTPPPQGTPPPAGSGESGELTLQAIKDKGKLVIGGEMSFEPFEYFDEDENIVGFDIDLWNLIAADLGVETEFVDLPFSGVLTGLDAGQYDVVGCAVGASAERAKSYNLSYPVMSVGIVAVKLAGNDSIKTVDDLSGKTVGVQMGSTAEMTIEAWSKALVDAGKPAVKEVKKYTGPTDSFVDLANGGLDAACEADLMVASLMLNNPGVYEIVGFVETKVTYACWAFRQQDKELYDFVNSEIEKFKEDGTLAELQEKWFGFSREVPSENYIPAE